MYTTPREAWKAMLERLDKWSRVAAAMFEDMGWTWYMRDQPSPRVPNAQELHEQAYAVLWAALQEVEKPASGTPSGYDAHGCLVYEKPTHSCVASGRLEARFALYRSGWVCTLCIPVCEERT